jgi:hypothetical protein
MGARLGADFRDVVLHTDSQAAASAEQLGAKAYTAGSHIVFGRGQFAPGTERGRHLLAHELTHVVQQRGRTQSAAFSQAPATMARTAAAENAAEAAADHVDAGSGSHRTSGPVVMPSIAEKILKFAAKQLEERTIRTVSKHIARHARRIAGRAIHSIFRNPKEIHYIIERAVREATEVAAKHPRAGADAMIEEAGIRITRQVTGTPGKFRLLIQKVFDREIGTQGERILRIVLDQSGRIVSAFPADRLAVLGLTAAGIDALTEGTARAGTAAQAQVAKSEAAEKARQDRFDIMDWMPVIGDIWGGALNEGEDQMIREDREIAALVEETISDVEKTEKRSLGEPERRELEQLIRAAISSPLVMEDTDEG